VSEPAVAAMLGYGTGEHAPGRRMFLDVLGVAHHLLLAHGRAAIELRAAGAASVGCANNHSPMWPASDDEADIGATKLFDALWNGLFLEPMLLGRYPSDLAPLLEEVVQPGDLATIRQPLDFYGVNYYSPIRVAAAEEDSENPFRFVPLLGHEQTASGWSVVPHALREWLILTRARFRAGLPPFVITESGASFHEQPGPDGVVDDQNRIAYLRAHLEAVSAAVARGVDVRGYYVWSLLDCFEWSNGWTTPYGLVHVDRETLARTPKRSFEWYSDLIAAQAAAPSE
jgi:beta-glucosidase